MSSKYLNENLVVARVGVGVRFGVGVYLRIYLSFFVNIFEFLINLSDSSLTSS